MAVNAGTMFSSSHTQLSSISERVWLAATQMYTSLSGVCSKIRKGADFASSTESTVPNNNPVTEELCSNLLFNLELALTVMLKTQLCVYDFSPVESRQRVQLPPGFFCLQNPKTKRSFQEIHYHFIRILQQICYNLVEKNFEVKNCTIMSDSRSV